MAFEVEIRSFLSTEEYERLRAYFDEHGTLIRDDYNETYYFDAPVDVRIQRNNGGAKIVYKKGRVHDESREEHEVPVSRESFQILEGLFSDIGIPVKIKWFRKRREYQWNTVNVCIDETLGYGKIIELEIVCAQDADVDAAREHLKAVLENFGISRTPREEFEKKFADYAVHWLEQTEQVRLEENWEVA